VESIPFPETEEALLLAKLRQRSGELQWERFALVETYRLYCTLPL
jgi:hypothetical protein